MNLLFLSSFCLLLMSVAIWASDIIRVNDFLLDKISSIPIWPGNSGREEATRGMTTAEPHVFFNFCFIRTANYNLTLYL